MGTVVEDKEAEKKMFGYIQSGFITTA